MRTQFNKLSLLLLVVFTTTVISAKENGPGQDGKKVGSTYKVTSGCAAPKSSAELKVNNVRAIIFTGGDMWWDLFSSGSAYYVIPNVENKSKWISSNFAGSLWIGGVDQGGQLKIAAMTYRQNGIDFWPGPLDRATTDVTADECSRFDKIYKITRQEVDDWKLNAGVMTQAIRDWPGTHNDSQGQTDLAPYKDVDGSGDYSPDGGDYPAYDIYGNEGKDISTGVCNARLFGDETLFWVFNDKGNIHTETKGLQIGLEIRAQAFGFKTNDEINNMTFYNYEVINRSTFALNQTYFSVWTDADLGYYLDDYVGCDVGLGLGFIYNANPNDPSISGTNGYGDYPPALGCDFFRGPIADVGDNVDNDRDGSTDEPGEQIIMSNFTFYNNNIGPFPDQTINPDLAAHFYNYMRGFWKDNSPFTCGGNAYGGSTATKFVFPWDTDPNNTCGNWSEHTAGNLPGDRRFIQSAGPFTLAPGAVNNVTFGLPWAQTPNKGQPLLSVSLMKTADKKAQALFDNCFKLLEGPEAPDLTIQELDNELILYLSNKPTSNNYLNKYEEVDPTIVAIDTIVPNPDRKYRFEGYKIYQLKDNTVSQTDLEDATKAKLIYQCDVKNGVTKLVNWTFDPLVGEEVPKVRVEGADNGIQTTFKVVEDQFGIGTDRTIVNNKTYYFMVTAYAYNQYLKYAKDKVPVNSQDVESYYGQKKPFLEGRKVKKASGIPHIPTVEKEGTIINSFYGYGPKIKRIEGWGNGGSNLDLTQASIDEALSTGRSINPVYENARGPVNVKVVDPLNVPNAEFSVRFVKNNLNSLQYSDLKEAITIGDSTTWILKNLNTGEEYKPNKSIKSGEEYYFDKIGLSLTVAQVVDAGANLLSGYNIPINQYSKGDVIDATMTFSDPSKSWLTGVKDRDGDSPYNWIRSGASVSSTTVSSADYNDVTITASLTATGEKSNIPVDPDQLFENVIDGTWAPYALCAMQTGTSTTNPTGVLAAPGPLLGSKKAFSTSMSIQKENYHHKLVGSVDIVFTSDQNKWTRCVVLEEQDDPLLAQGGAQKLGLRRHLSVDKNGIPYGNPNNQSGYNDADASKTSTTGMGWFPGYAINVETGERLNIAFGEDSWLASENGRDMIWNPTSREAQGSYPAFGGRHYIYVFGHNKDLLYGSNVSGLTGKPRGANLYDACQSIFDQLSYAEQLEQNSPSSAAIPAIYKNVFYDAMWVNMPMITESRYHFNHPSAMPCDVKVRLRVKKAYHYGYSGALYHRSPISTTLLSNSAPYPDVTYIASIPGATAERVLTKDTSSAPQNNNYPMYTFSTADIYTTVGDADAAKNGLDLINVVPNPYYGYSSYETNRIDSRIRITNLPNKCTIKIYTLNGTLVRTFKRDVSGQEDEVLSESDFRYSKRRPYQDWDLKNQSGIPIASGLYIIHVDVPNVGEKILKWFGVMRPLDLQNY